MAQKLTLRLNGTQAEAEVRQHAEGTRVRIDDRWHEVEFERTGRHDLYSLLIDGRSFEVYARARPGGWEILIGTDVISVDTGTARTGRGGRAAQPPDGAWSLRSPLAGIVVETRVAVGDRVEAGDVLFIVESMKMNNELTAARGGTVTAVAARAGERVERGALLVQIE